MAKSNEKFEDYSYWYRRYVPDGKRYKIPLRVTPKSYYKDIGGREYMKGINDKGLDPPEVAVLHSELPP